MLKPNDTGDLPLFDIIVETVYSIHRIKECTKNDIDVFYKQINNNRQVFAQIGKCVFNKKQIVVIKHEKMFGH